MYYPNDIEDICYEQEHIDKVWDEMKQIIPDYFQRYIDTEGGHSVQDSESLRNPALRLYLTVKANGMTLLDNQLDSIEYCIN